MHRTNARPAMRELAFLAVTCMVIWACVTLYVSGSGIPLSHEGLSYLQRVAVYVDHFQQGDFFPLWASHDAYGMGSPQPLFYHKTFYYLSALLAIMLGSVQASIAASLALFMLVGAYGMRLAAQKLTTNFVLQLCAAQGLLLSNYSFTDWLVRGAMAEFSVLMLVPWLAWWCLTLVKDARFSFGIVPILYLMVQAHNITALFGMIAICIAAAIFLVRERGPGMARVWRRGLVSVAVFWLLLAPQLLAQWMMLADYDPSRITQLGYQASTGFLAPMRYFWDSEYAWLANWMVFTPQIDFGIWIAALLLLVTFIIQCLIPSGSCRQHLRKRLPELAFLACGLAVFLTLQFRVSTLVYESLPPLQLLQFPWRLLVYITVLGLLLVVAGLDTLVKPQRWRAVVGVLWAASFLVLSPLTQRGGVPPLPQAMIDELLVQRDAELTGTVMQGLGEYRSRILHGNGKEFSATESLEAFKTMHEQGRQLQVLSGSCQVHRLYSEGGGEVLERRFQYRCLSDSVVALPVSYSRLMLVEDGITQAPLAFHRLPTDPRTRVQLKAGTGNLLVRLPSTATLARSFRRRLSLD